MHEFSAITSLSEPASNQRHTICLSDLGAFAVRFTGEKRICFRPVIVWIDRLFPVSEIKSKSFPMSSVKLIIISRTIEILGSGCFFFAKSLSSISIESDSRLKGIDSEAFQSMTLTSARVPATVKWINADAFLWSCRGPRNSTCLVM
jgi:hypothetical protein